MSTYDNIISSAIKKMALIETESARQSLKNDAKKHSFSKWKKKMIVKTSGVGFLTGLPGGPVGLTIEALDLAYLLAMAGRACYGVGYIENKDVDFDNDIPIILGIWAGALSATPTIAIGKIGVKVAGKMAISGIAPIVGKVAGKLVAKSAFKSGGKMAGKIIAIASTKLVTKLTAKVGLKFIPLIGGLAGAGINWYIIDEMMESARVYYRNDYVTFNDNIAKDIVT